MTYSFGRPVDSNAKYLFRAFLSLCFHTVKLSAAKSNCNKEEVMPCEHQPKIFAALPRRFRQNIEQYIPQ